ncbi:NeuD/PglB/VioB family sugar acetyltransferase [Frankia sp. AiPa1]|uniref:NeuD/PglB/VioB family sugar acetyltransferase n=1 Tax=Frankia sp. AiPa1 TaxID=573492 RepID=UPI00202B3445|nr:NeuD/PglB/VioB family sugar acetyltransferase [Frankia sp. AiPa1]MCL9758515.1 NeuD/PglB/VioB family sugar acetyltransferase [Frankia sp. AiPa1]
MPDTPRPLTIVGAGGHGRELLDVVEAVNAASSPAPYAFLGFLDDGHGGDPGAVARRGAALLGGLDLLGSLDADYLIGVEDALARARVDRYASVHGRRPVTLVHPRASLGGDVQLGPGTVVYALASITTNVRTGRHVVVNIGASVAHDCRLGDYVTLAPGARIAGGVTIGAQAWIGAQASIVGRRRIGERVVVGTGSVVTDDIRAVAVVTGVPARPIDTIADHPRAAPRPRDPPAGRRDAPLPEQPG